MARFFDDDQSLNTDRARALHRRALLVGALGALFTLVALFVTVRVLARIWDRVQSLSGVEVPSLHLPASLQAASGSSVLSWLALLLLVVGLYGLTTGQEASITGSAYPLRATDWLFPALRETGAAMWRGYVETNGNVMAQVLTFK